MKKPLPLAPPTLPMTTTKPARKPAAKTTRRTQDERSKDTQQRVIAAALEMLRRKGYAGFRVSDVAEAAKVSRGAQTHHFPTKDSMVLAALEHIFEQSTEKSLQRVQALKPNDDVIAAFLQDGEDFFFSPFFAVALDLLNLGTHGTKFHKRVKAIARENRLRVEEAWSTALVARGVAEKLAGDILLLSFSIVRGLAIRRLILDETQRSDTLRIQEATDLWRNIVTAMISGRKISGS